MTMTSSLGDQLTMLRTLMGDLNMNQKEKMAECGSLMKSIKSQLVKMDCLFAAPTGGDVDVLRDQWIKTREILELSCCFDAIKESIEDFSNSSRILDGVYFHPFVLANLEPSPRQALLVGLTLMWQLVTADMCRFHLLFQKITTLGTSNVKTDSLSSAAIGGGDTNNEFAVTDYCFFGKRIRDLSERDRTHLLFPLELERLLTQGNMSRVVAYATGTLPDPLFQWMSRELVTSLRIRAALCCESAYSTLSVKHAMSVLAIDDLEAFRQFVQNQNQRNADAAAVLGDEENPVTSLSEKHSMFPESTASARHQLTRMLGTMEGKPPSVVSGMSLFSLATRPIPPKKWEFSPDGSKLLFIDLIKESSTAVPMKKVLENFIGYATVWESVF